jgi:chromate transporter
MTRHIDPGDDRGAGAFRGAVVRPGVRALFVASLGVGASGFGGVLPFVRRMLVERQRWLTDAEFAQQFALSQAAPGPNVLIVSLIGWKVAGVAGAVTATVAMCGPSSLLTYGVAQVWDRFRHAPLRIAIERALAPLTVGLTLAAGYVLTRATADGWAAYAVMATTAVLAVTTRMHPLAMLAVAAALGAAGLV